MTSRAILQRCACGKSSKGECPECKKKRDAATLQRSAVSTTTPQFAPPIVHDVLRSSGSPLDSRTRAHMEPRLGHSFENVRVHTGVQASKSAQAVNAHAYAVGHHVVFGEGQYNPHSDNGQKLLAHELVHTVQQGGVAHGEHISIVPASDSSEHEANAKSVDNIGERTNDTRLSKKHGLMRKIVVNKSKGKVSVDPADPKKKESRATVVEGYLNTLCGSGGIKVDATSGEPVMSSGYCDNGTLPKDAAGPPPQSPAQASATATGCTCLCDLISSSNNWTIKVEDGVWPHTDYLDDAKASDPTSGGTGGSVTCPSPGSKTKFGAATTSGSMEIADPWLILGHELCGHAWLANHGGTGPDEAKVRGRGGHQETVGRENKLRKEHSLSLRGSHKDPLCGESYSMDDKGKIKWSDSLDECRRWRKELNRKTGTKYTIYSKIP